MYKNYSPVSPEEIRSDDLSGIQRDLFLCLGCQTYLDLIRSGIRWIAVPRTDYLNMITRNKRIVNDFHVNHFRIAQLSRLHRITSTYCRQIVYSPQAKISKPIIEREDFSEERRKIIDVIGLDKYIDMIHEFSGLEIKMPTWNYVVHLARNRAIIRDYYSNGLEVGELGQKYGLSRRSVWCILNGAAHNTRREFFDCRNEDIASDSQNGNSYSCIADEYNLTSGYVGMICRGYEWKKSTAIQERDQKIISAFFDSHIGIDELCEIFLLSAVSIRRILYSSPQHKAKIQFRKNRNNQIIQDYTCNHLTVKEICDKYSVSDSTVYYLLKYNNLVE